MKRASRTPNGILVALLSALAWIASAALPSGSAHADDTEVYLASVASSSAAQPNILFIMDTSGSMDTLVVTRPAFNPATTYADAGCGSNRVYWVTASTRATPPRCGSSQWFAADANKCFAAADSLATSGNWVNHAMAQWRSSSGGSWQDIRTSQQTSANPVECAEDSGVHGIDAVSAARYAVNSNAKWTVTAASSINWNTRTAYNLYSANYLNWYNGVSTVSATRLEIVQQAAVNLANSISNVNIGLMRYSNNNGGLFTDAAAEGGMVTHEVANIASSRTTIVNAINSYVADGYTPMSETLYEAGQYFKGGAVDYGLNSRIVSGGAIVPSVAASRDPGNTSRYLSPIRYPCQKNYIIFLTDGLPTRDTSADTAARIRNADFQATLGRTACTGTGDGACLDDMAAYLHNADLDPTMSGMQNVTSYFIGFGSDLANAGDFAFLEQAAAAGGGAAYPANDVGDLTTVLSNIISDIQYSSTTFNSPTVSINVFNRARSLDELYVSVFKPDDRIRWDGNLKKYKFGRNLATKDLEIQGQDDQPAVDPDAGFFYDGLNGRPKAFSFWSLVADGAEAARGGAASQLPDPTTRQVYTDIAGPVLTAAGNRVDATNSAISPAMLGNPTSAPTRDELIAWMRGQDIDDENDDGSTTDPRHWMGDPIHSRPAVVIYGGSASSPSATDAVVFVPTNEGYLHAIDGKTGGELWAYMPQQLLGRTLTLYQNPTSATRNYGIDGDIRVLKFDKNQNGVVESADGDKVFLFFGLRRGGNAYYALDVTEREKPKLLWTHSSADAGFGRLGKAWSTPTVARVRVDAATQNNEFFVLVFGGGYEDDQDTPGYNTDATGNGIYMVDALNGTLLWSAGGPASGASLELTASNNRSDMNNSIPGDIVVIDTNGDAFADRMYAADTGGRVWRFDIFNGQPAATLVTGGSIARLGAADLGAAGDFSNTRKFYNAPDVSLIQRRGAAPFYNLAIGSGFRGHPLNMQIHDRFYSLRDYNPLGKLTQVQYKTSPMIIEGDLVNITNNPTATFPAGTAGWFFELKSGTSWVGEKVLSESVTVNNIVLFPTYTPPSSAPTACSLPNGTNKAYALAIDTGRAAIDFNEDGVITTADYSVTLKQSGIASELAVLLDRDGPLSSSTSNSATSSDTLKTWCGSGVEGLKHCVGVGGTGRTYWRKDAN